MRHPVSIKDLLGKAVQRAGIDRQVAVAQVLEAADEAVRRLLPRGRAADARAAALRDGALIVACRHASAAQAVARGAPSLLDAVKRASPKADVRRVVTRLESDEETR